MTLSFTEVSAIYAKVQLGDNRKPLDEVLNREWADTLNRSGESFEDLIAAVTEYRATQPGRWLEPGHLIQIAKRARLDRAEKAHHRELASGRKEGHPAPANSAEMTVAYRAHDRAYDAWLAHPCDEHQAALDQALGEVQQEEAAYNRQLMEAGLPPIDNPIPLRGMPSRGGLWG